MGARQKEWARRKRVELTELLGGKCAQCGSTEGLEFDCKQACGDRHHRMDTSARMSFYRAQHKAGNLQLLCSPCNTRKSGDEQPLPSNCPF